MGKEDLYDYLIHYNHITDCYSAFRREDHSAYFNGFEPDYPIIKAKNIKHIIEYITKNKGKIADNNSRYD
jgi:hypothetical protein